LERLIKKKKKKRPHKIH